ncbi:MAG TPA: DUF255 domain-containing protein [Bacteroidia bacterium]|nr:DUF255 domain-containing protein [Bacteroidia bacterium]
MKIKFILIIFVFNSILFLSQNVIQWQKLDNATFEKARKENKYIVLHLAANWCHWCHVMEEKTYHHPKVIELLNKKFIACYEDHDQRPDLANRYREYGWPATIVFNPNGKEVLKETGYIPPDEYIQKLQNVLSNKNIENEKTSSSNTSLSSAGNNLKYIYKDVMNSIDLKVGGFASAQKSVDFEMFEYAFNHPNDSLNQWLKITMTNSKELLDKEWGGVYQYSTYSDWNHPHYEKLLSVQARYIKMYLWYFYKTNDSTYFKYAIKIFNYTKRFYLKKNNTFANAQDADLIKGKKAHDYFSLSDKERVKLGIPSIDTNAFTDNNSKMIESLIYLYAYTEDSSYLKIAKDNANYIIKYRKRIDGFFNHAYQNDLTPSLSDQIYFVKALIVLYKSTSDNFWLNECNELVNNIIEKFLSKNCLKSFLPLQNYLEPTCIVSENIEGARIINFLGKILNNEKYIHTAEAIFHWLISDEVYEQIIVEPGILTLAEELKKEPYSALYLVKNENQNPILYQTILQTPKFYLLTYLMTEKNILKEKQELWEAFNDSVVLFCTSTFCSSPMKDEKEIKEFVRNKLLE